MTKKQAGNHNILFVLVFTALCIALPCTISHAFAEYSFETEWEPYYSNAGLYLGLTDQPIPEVIENDETGVYNRMFDSAFTLPRFMLIEFGIYPLPYLGAYTKEHHLDTFDKFEIGDVNLIQAFTAGYDEPYAISLFFGSIVRFVNPGEKKKTKNRGFTGYLLSFGDQHIVQNTLVDDNWYELEWKIKGDQDFKNKTLSWSLRVGGKVHDNPNITDVLYFGIRRNHLDVASDEISWFHNADIEYRLELDKDNLHLSQQSLFINKKWPAPFSCKSTFQFGVGFILERNKYTGALKSQADEFQLILRPSFNF